MIPRHDNIRNCTNNVERPRQFYYFFLVRNWVIEVPVYHTVCIVLNPKARSKIRGVKTSVVDPDPVDP
jgi:hypothetical protein